jgi:hypothetical protein
VDDKKILEGNVEIFVFPIAKVEESGKTCHVRES